MTTRCHPLDPAYSHRTALPYSREGVTVCLWPFRKPCRDRFPTPSPLHRAHASRSTWAGNVPNPAHPITKKH